MHFTFVLAAFVGNAAAHGVVSSFKTDGAEHQGYMMNYYYDTKNGKALPPLAAWSAENLDNGFVSPNNYTHPDIICQKNGKPANLTVQVAAGGAIDFQWTKWAHFDSMMTYVAPCNGDCSAVDKTTLKWVKIDEAGIDFDTQEWAARKMVNNNRTWTTKIPSTLAAGNYVFRHEIIAVHGSNRIGGVQNYPQCFNIETIGSGTAKPEGVLGTKLYTPTDPGLYFNPYTILKNYTIPGPPLFKDGNGGLTDGSVRSSIAKDQTIAPIIATTLVTSRLPKPTTFEAITNAFPTATSVPSDSSPKPSASGCRAVRKAKNQKTRHSRF
ncbi:hypothetical protein FOMG_03202 [Fusarium oxysporum f. sp. melonis 26406]|uniref:lytic cellulose monooxygenase (C4-dehydrogenating) n=1 Tax=Fusarium oxysporum f. sp. melonis 26406 TaxID=1089452 RepID=X0BHH3_FUSOX|nr:hypothetical protein FOMG_03202 [Fusarium oxysporum f. sp. melonis 26406]